MIEAEIASLADGIVANVRDSTFTDDGNDNSIRMSADRLVRTTGGDGAANAFTGDALPDVILGRSGTDTIGGGAANDRLSGGAAADIFFFNTALNPQTNVDNLTDFTTADLIRLDDAVFTRLDPGPLPPSALHIGTAAADANDRIIYNPVSGALTYDANGTGAGQATRFATLDKNLSLSAADFRVF